MYEALGQFAKLSGLINLPQSQSRGNHIPLLHVSPAAPVTTQSFEWTQGCSPKMGWLSDLPNCGPFCLRPGAHLPTTALTRWENYSGCCGFMMSLQITGNIINQSMGLVSNITGSEEPMYLWLVQGNTRRARTGVEPWTSFPHSWKVIQP